MKVKRLLAGIVMAVLGVSMTGLISVSADAEPKSSGYTIEDIKNLQDFCLQEKHRI